MEDEYKDKCFECGHELEHRHGYCVDDPNVGLVQTDGEYWHCPACGQDEVPYETMKAVGAERKRLIDMMLWADVQSSPDFDGKFIQPNEMSKLLGISRQAIDQSRTLGNLIYNITIKGVRYWLRESAELYKRTGDGRFPLFDRLNGSTGGTAEPQPEVVECPSINIIILKQWQEEQTRSSQWNQKPEKIIA